MYLEGPEAFARGVVFMDVVYMVQSLGERFKSVNRTLLSNR